MTAAERIPALQNGDGRPRRPGDDDDLRPVAGDLVLHRVLHGGQRLLVPVDSPVKSIDDLGGKKVCAATGSTNITAIAAADVKPIPVAATDALDCMVLLQQGQIDAVSTDDAILAGFAAQDPSTQRGRVRRSPPRRTASAIAQDRTPTWCASSTACWSGCAPTAPGRRSTSGGWPTARRRAGAPAARYQA